MAKGQKRSTRETKKPKADKKPAGSAASILAPRPPSEPRKGGK